MRPRPPRIPQALAVALLGAVAALAGCRGAGVGGTTVAVAREAVAADAAGPRLDVALLQSPDFEARARASERLLAAGERALPALSRAGDLAVAGPGGQAVSATRPILEGIVAGLPDARLLVLLEDPSAALRRAVATELGARDRWDVVPRLIERLEDEDPGVRAASAASLRRLTNQFFGFVADAGAVSRRTAAARWRGWWAVEGRARAGAPERSAGG